MSTQSMITVPSGRAMSSGEIYMEMKRRLDAGEKAAAMATVVKTKGSTPQHEGAKMVVFTDGSFIGTVGGGCLEADIYAQCRDVLHSGQAGIFDFTLADDYADEEGMVCGGTMVVLIERWAYDE